MLTFGTGFNSDNQAGPTEFNFRIDFVLERGRKRLIAVRRGRKDLDVDSGRTEGAAQTENAAWRTAVAVRRREVRRDVQNAH